MCDTPYYPKVIGKIRISVTNTKMFFILMKTTFYYYYLFLQKLLRRYLRLSINLTIWFKTVTHSNDVYIHCKKLGEIPLLIIY